MMIYELRNVMKPARTGRGLLLFFALCSFTLSGQTKKILVETDSEDFVKDLQSASSQVRVVGVTKANAMQEIGDADAYVGAITPAEVRAGKKLRWVKIMSGGAETVLFKSGGNDLRKSKMLFTKNKSVKGIEICDHAFAMLLMLSRDLYTFYDNKQHEVWQPPRPFPGIEVNGRNAVGIGVGGIGMQIATRAWAFGMNVVGVDPEDKPFSPFLKKVVKPDQLDEVLPDADVVFVSAPHTPMSNKMVGAKEFELMKKDAYFIAVSRGGLYDMGGLVKALDSKRLAGAGGDVTDPEPVPKGHPLWKFPNGVVPPHVAGRADQDSARMVGAIKENIQRFVDGKPLVNVVDKQKGY